MTCRPIQVPTLHDTSQAEETPLKLRSEVNIVLLMTAVAKISSIRACMEQ